MIEKWNEVIGKLHGLKQSGSGYTACCPVRAAHRHNDKEASLSLAMTEDRILIKCHTGCSFSEIVSALDMQPAEFFSRAKEDETPKKYTPGKRRYVYTDVKGKPLYSSEREETQTGKTFKQSTWVDGKWVSGRDKSGPAVPYRLDEWHDKNGTIFIVEGEKAADALRDAGVNATTGAGGSANTGQWLGWKKYFKNFDRIFILPDNDGPGWKYAQAVQNAVGGMIIDAAYYYEKTTGHRIGISGDVADIIEKLGNEKTLELLRDAVRTEKEEAENPKDVYLTNDTEDLLRLINWNALDNVCPNIREMCEVYAEFTQSEPHIILGAFMTATAGLAQRFIRGVQMNRNWREAISMFSVFVADSGRNKSGVVRLFGKPLDEICKQHNQNISDARIEWEAQYAMAKMRRKTIEKDAEKESTAGDFWKERSAQELIDAMKEIKQLEDEAPRPINSIMTQDTTVEALVKALYFDKMSSGIIWSHEIKKLFTIILGEYKRGAGGQADDTSLITAYDNDTISVSRKGVSRMDEPNEKIDIYDSSLSIFGGIQTAVFDKIRDKGNMAESGFLGRFLFWIDSNPDPMKIILDSDETNERFDKWEGFVGDYMKNLFEMGEDRYNTWKQTGNSDEALRQTIKMSESAKAYHAQLYNERTWDERRRGGDLWSENGWFGKIHGMHVRIAAVLYIMRCVMTGEDIMRGEIGVEEVKAAESITLYEAAIARLMLEDNNFDMNSPERVRMRINDKMKECIKYMVMRKDMFNNNRESFIFHISPLNAIDQRRYPTLADDVMAELFHRRYLIPAKFGNGFFFNRKGFEIALEEKMAGSK